MHEHVLLFVPGVWYDGYVGGPAIPVLEGGLGANRVSLPDEHARLLPIQVLVLFVRD